MDEDAYFAAGGPIPRAPAPPSTGSAPSAVAGRPHAARSVSAAPTPPAPVQPFFAAEAQGAPLYRTQQDLVSYLRVMAIREVNETEEHATLNLRLIYLWKERSAEDAVQLVSLGGYGHGVVEGAGALAAMAGRLPFDIALVRERPEMLFRNCTDRARLTEVRFDRPSAKMPEVVRCNIAFTGVFRTPFHFMRHFPFDRSALEVKLRFNRRRFVLLDGEARKAVLLKWIGRDRRFTCESAGWFSDMENLIESPLGVEGTLRVPGWDKGVSSRLLDRPARVADGGAEGQLELAPLKKAPRTAPRKEDVPPLKANRAMYMLPMQRRSSEWVTSFVLPMYLVQVLALASFAVEHATLLEESRLALTLALFITLVAFRINLHDAVPRSSTTTYVDRVFIFTTVMLFLVAGLNVFASLLTDEDDRLRADLLSAAAVVGLNVLAVLLVPGMRPQRASWASVSKRHVQSVIHTTVIAPQSSSSDRAALFLERLMDVYDAVSLVGGVLAEGHAATELLFRRQYWLEGGSRVRWTEAGALRVPLYDHSGRSALAQVRRLLGHLEDPDLDLPSAHALSEAARNLPAGRRTPVGLAGEGFVLTPWRYHHSADGGGGREGGGPPHAFWREFVARAFIVMGKAANCYPHDPARPKQQHRDAIAAFRIAQRVVDGLPDPVSRELLAVVYNDLFYAVRMIKTPESEMAALVMGERALEVVNSVLAHARSVEELADVAEQKEDAAAADNGDDAKDRRRGTAAQRDMRPLRRVQFLKATVLRNLCRVKILTGDTAGAVETARDALALANQIKAPTYNALKALGAVEKLRSNWESSRYYFEQALLAIMRQRGGVPEGAPDEEAEAALRKALDELTSNGKLPPSGAQFARMCSLMAASYKGEVNGEDAPEYQLELIDDALLWAGRYGAIVRLEPRFAYAYWNGVAYDSLRARRRHLKSRLGKA